MVVNNSKLQIALASACMNPYDLCAKVDISYQTYRRISTGKERNDRSAEYTGR